jgi:hypothetical protein
MFPAFIVSMPVSVLIKTRKIGRVTGCLKKNPGKAGWIEV